MDKNDYIHSHRFMVQNPDVDFLVYPSCRDPNQGTCAAVLNIQHLSKTPKWEFAINFFYDHQFEEITWLNYNLHINWLQIS